MDATIPKRKWHCLRRELNRAVASTGFDASPNTSLLNQSWLFYAVSTNSFMLKRCRKVVQGARLSACSIAMTFAQSSLPLLPLNEQRRIVAKIEELFLRPGCRGCGPEAGEGESEAIPCRRSQSRRRRQAHRSMAGQASQHRTGLEASRPHPCSNAARSGKPTNSPSSPPPARSRRRTGERSTSSRHRPTRPACRNLPRAGAGQVWMSFTTIIWRIRFSEQTFYSGWIPSCENCECTCWTT